MEGSRQESDLVADYRPLTSEALASGSSPIHLPLATRHSPLILGTVSATKPAWMRRRQSDNDLELLTWLADGVGEWLAGLWPELSSQGSASGPGGPAARRGVRGQQRQTKPRILIADDDPRIQDLLRRILLPDYEVATASDGDEALALVCRNSPDCLILDLRLPGLDGFAVCEALRADSATRHVPILILSGLSDPADKVRALELGADDYVTKPFDVPELHARLQALLRRTQPKTSE